MGASQAPHLQVSRTFSAGGVYWILPMLLHVCPICHKDKADASGMAGKGREHGSTRTASRVPKRMLNWLYVW